MKASDPKSNNSHRNNSAKAKSKVGTKMVCSETERGKFLLELYQKALLLSDKELYDYFLNHAVRVTGSKIGFLHFVSEDQKSILLTAWNKEALKNCVANYDTHYPVASAGNWVDSLRLKHPIIYNDYAKSPNQKGFPSGHILIKRFMSIPPFDVGKVQIVFGVGNKTDPYTEDDVVQLQLIANELAKIYKQRQAEKTLRESEKKYRSLFENMLSGFALCKMIFDQKNNAVDFVCLEVNDAFEPVTGLKKDAVVGKKATEILPGIECADFNLFEISGAVALTGKAKKFEVFSTLLNRWLLISLYCPEKGYFAAVLEDITERKKVEEALRESEQRLRFHAENTPLAVVEWDNNFVVTRWSGDAEKMFGWNAKETVGKPIMDLHMIYEPDIPIVQKTMARLISGEVKVVGLNRNITKDGRVIYCAWYNSVLLDEKGKMVSVFSFVEDNTPRVDMEKSLEENNKNLEKLVEERTKQLKDAERLAAIGATAGMVGHDIRNPLQAITGDVFLLRSELVSPAHGRVKKEIKDSLDGIDKNIEYINKIVADLQDFARPLNPHVEETNLKIIMQDLLAKSRLPSNVKVSLKVEIEATKVVTDVAYINRIMNNLITNAVQAMPKGGKLTIHAAKNENDVAITVEDTGVGVPADVKGKLFTPMFTTKSKGQGFGLPVVKRMAEALGGTVTFESQEGKGTTFMVLLPLQRREQ